MCCKSPQKCALVKLNIRLGKKLGFQLSHQQPLRSWARVAERTFNMAGKRVSCSLD